MKEKKQLERLYAKYFNLVDKKLYMYIKSNLNDMMSPLEKAVAIYLLLGDVVCFDEEFSAVWEWENLVPVSEVSLDNNRVVCKNWSELYVRLLRKEGINARVVEAGNHYYVSFKIEGFSYLADATNCGGYYRSDNYYLSDLCHIKYGFMIDGLFCNGWLTRDGINQYKEKCDQLTQTINDVYRKQNRKVFTTEDEERLRNKVRNNVVNYAQSAGFMTREDINHRINLINRFKKLNIAGGGVEKRQLFNKFVFEVFREFSVDELGCYTFWFLNNGKWEVGKLLAVCSLEGFRYFLETDGILVEYDGTELKEELDRRNALQRSVPKILGLDLNMKKYTLYAKYFG